MKIRDRIKSFRRVPAKDLAPNPRNWRTHPKAQREAMRGVLAEIGYADACLARELPDGSLRLVDGHLRTETTPDQKIPMLILNITDEEEAKLLAVLDPLASMAEADGDALGGLLREVQTDSDGLKGLLDGLASDHGIDLFAAGGEEEAPEPQIDRAAELQAEWKTELGQLWEIPGKAGVHRLLCGDSTKGEDVASLMGEKKAFLMATDPPYGVDFKGAKYNPRAKEWDGIEGDKLHGEMLEEWLANCIEVWLAHMRPESAFYFWTAAMAEGAAAAAAIRKVGLHIQSQIIWNKNTLVLGQADYHWKHENCWYAFWKGKKHRWFGERDKTTVWDVAKLANASYEHPMQKPTELYAIPIRHHTKSGEIVADPFCGSGTQMVAAEQLGRICYGIEIEPKYVAVALQRMKDMGLEPRLAE